MSKIEIKRLTFAYPGQKPLFEQADFNLDSQWHLGLVGRNGRGKTTLLRLLLGQLPYQGSIDQQQQFNYFPQAISDKTQLTDDILLALTHVPQWQIEREFRQLQLTPDLLWQPFVALSGGEQTKALLAALFVVPGRFPLLDEPTNHLDLRSRQQVAAYLQQKYQGFIVVSHDQSFLNQVTDHTLAIEKNKISCYQGNFAVYQKEKQLSDQFEQAQNDKLKKEISRLRQTAAKKVQWSQSREKDKYGHPQQRGSGAVMDTGFIGARAARTMKRAKQLQRRLSVEVAQKQRLLKNVEQVVPLQMNFQPSRHQQLLNVQQLRLGYQQKWLFKPTSFTLENKQCVALVGPNGSGKTSLIQYLKGQFTGQVQGNVQRPVQLAISYVSQNYEKNQGKLADFAIAQKLDLQVFLNNLHKLGLPRTAFNLRIEDLSMGQRKKVELAKSLSQPAALYVWDEPLNYLDIYNQEQLVQLLHAIRPTLLLIEHDQSFINRVAAQIVSLK